MTDYTTTLVESRLDWLTVTRRAKADDYELVGLAKEMADLEASVGNRRQPFIWRGYEGEHCGRLSWGTREDGTILQLTGQAADTWFERVWPLATNTTRVDVCCTVRYDPPTEGVAAAVYQQFNAWQPPNGIRPAGRFIVGTDGGSTAYIGSPASDRLSRCYDKWRESQDDEYRGCWRWEVVSKGELANALACSLGRCPSRRHFCADFVRKHYERRGCSVPWQSYGNDVQLPASHPPTNQLKQLQWLKRSVQPVVKRLAETGWAGEAAAALGFPSEVCIVAREVLRGGRGSHSDDFGDLRPIDIPYSGGDTVPRRDPSGPE